MAEITNSGKQPSITNKYSFLSGGGEMGESMRNYDWEAHPLGNPLQWTQSLKNKIHFLLQSASPVFLWWSEEFYFFHNDAYLQAFGKKSSQSPGASARITGEEIWDQLGKTVEAVLHKGEPFFAEDYILVLNRNGFPEESYWTISLSPDSNYGKVEGIIGTCSEITKKLLGERRLKTLKDIAAVTANSRTAEKVSWEISEILNQNEKDIPFSLIYLLNQEGNEAKLMGKTGRLPDEATPALINLSFPFEGKSWPLVQVKESQRPEILSDFVENYQSLTGGIWENTPNKAFVVPIHHPWQDQITGFFIAGISPRLPFDEDYKGFIQLIASQLELVLAKVKPSEEDRKQEETPEEMDKAITALFNYIGHETGSLSTVKSGMREEVITKKENNLLKKKISEQTEARQRVEESEEKYRSLFNLMDQGFCIIEVIFDSDNTPIDYRFLELNPMFEKQTGLKAAAGKTARELLPDLEAHWFEIYGRVALTGESKRFIEGSEVMGRWFEVYTFRLGGNESRKVAILFTEISERKQAEETLKRSNEWFRLVNKATQDAIWDWDLEKKKIKWNETVQTMFEYKPDEVKQDEKWWYEHVHPEDRDRILNTVYEVIDSGRVHWSAEYRFLTGTGGFKIVYDRGFVIHNEAGKPIRMIGSMQDITEHKQAEEALKFQSHLNKTLTENATVALFMMDAQGRTTFMNPAAEKMTGFSFEEAKGEILHNLIHRIHPDGSIFPMEDCPIGQTVSRLGKLENHEDVFNRKDGSLFPVLCSASSIWESNELKGLILEVQDITERKLYEQTLRESEERFHNLADTAPIYMAMADESGNAIYFNKPWLDWTGREMKVMQGLGWLCTLHPDDAPKFEHDFKLAFLNQTPISEQYRFRRADGEYRWMLAVGAPRITPDGRFIGYFGTYTDVHELKQAQDALKESEDHFRTFANNTYNLAWMANPDGWIYWYNQRWYDYTGTTYEEMQGWGWEKVHHPDHIERVLAFAKVSWDKSEPWELTFPLRGKNGEYRWFLTRTFPVKDAEGKVIRWIGTNTDVDDQKRAETALKESEAKFRRIADSNIVGVAFWNTDGFITDANDAFLEMLGFTYEEMKERKIQWNEMSLPEYQVLHAIYVPKAIQGEIVEPYEIQMRHKEGQVVDILIGYAMLEGSQTEGLAYLLDITERKQAEKELKIKNEQLTRINNDLDNFIYTASHDLKAPITNLEGFLHALKRKIALPDERVNSIMEMMSLSIERFKNTIKDLTEVAKIQSDGEEDLSLISFQEMFDEVKLNIKNQIDDSGARIIEDFSQAPDIYFSKKNLRSILYNLVSNAVKYRAPERAVTINITTSKSDQSYILLTVQDNGLGIKEEDKEKVFTMFKRLHQHVEGTGVGLSIVKKIIDNNGGKIEIESEVDKGTLFKIYIKV